MKKLQHLQKHESLPLHFFDWKLEFPEVMNDALTNTKPGFDIVIGNPPYIQIQTLHNEQAEVLAKCGFTTFARTGDLYCLFMEKGTDLVRPSGVLSIIVSNSWLQSVSFTKTRIFMTHELFWTKALNISKKVFKAIVDTMVLIAVKMVSEESGSRVRVDTVIHDVIGPSHFFSWENVPKDGSSINIVAIPKERSLFADIKKKSVPLSELYDVYNGVKPFEKGKGIPPQTEKTMREKPFVFEGRKPSEKWKPLLRGSLINRYCNLWNADSWILYGKWLAAPRNWKLFEAPSKIAVRQTGDSLIATIISGGIVCRNNLHLVLPKKNSPSLNLLLALLNSKLFDFLYRTINPEKGEALAEVKKQHVEQLPLSTRFAGGKYDQSRIESIVGKIIKAKQADHASNTLPLEREVDVFVYHLYDLTYDEVKTVDPEFWLSQKEYEKVR